MGSTITADIAPNANIVSPTNIFYFLLAPALLLWYVYWKLSRRHMLELAEKIPGIPGVPLLGNALDLIGTSHRK